MRSVRLVILWSCLVVVGLAQEERERPRMDVLFLCVDDLRPELGCYGVETARTPELDAFARTARVFERHYVQVPTCGASRHALWTGRYPRTQRALDNGAFADLLDARTRRPTLPEVMRGAGWHTVQIGKVSHSPDGFLRAKESSPCRPEMPDAWDELPEAHGKWQDGWGAFFGYADGSSRQVGRSKPIEQADVPDAGYPDFHLAERAIQELGKPHDRPLFLAVGFYKPHLPFTAPLAYVQRQALPIDLAPWREPPSGVDPSISLHASGELLRNYGGHPDGRTVDDGYARALRLAYRSSVSYVDAQIGRVLRALERSGRAAHTIVVIWGDHGWHLGDHGIWGKHTLFERALHSTLMLRVPGMERPGVATQAIAESIDLYPTLLELCDVPVPPGLDGDSLVPTLENPAAELEPHALSYWKKGGVRGISLRTETHRYTEWRRGDDVVQRELYDHAADPFESRNLALEPSEALERSAAMLRRLSERR